MKNWDWTKFILTRDRQADSCAIYPIIHISSLRGTLAAAYSPDSFSSWNSCSRAWIGRELSCVCRLKWCVCVCMCTRSSMNERVNDIPARGQHESCAAYWWDRHRPACRNTKHTIPRKRSNTHSLQSWKRGSEASTASKLGAGRSGVRTPAK